MYNLARILAASPAGMYKSLGWRQPAETAYAIVDADNLSSASGMYFQDFHPLVTIKNLKNCASYATISNADFNTELDNLQKASIQKILNAVISNGDYIENDVLYPYEMDLETTITNGNNFVGFEFEIPKRKDILVKINQLITTFNAIDTFNIYVFHSSKQSPIHTFPVTTVANDEVVTNIADCLLYYGNTYKGGKFYVGYLQGDLTASAIDRNWDDADVAHKFKCVGIEPIKVSGWNAATLPDVKDIEYVSNTWGLNFDISSYYDYTDLILRNQRLFYEAIGNQVAADVLEKLVNNPRSNKEERSVQMPAMLALNGNGGENFNPDIPESVGILKKLRKNIKDLRKVLVDKKPIQTLTAK